jgi:hypothetical protein
MYNTTVLLIRFFPTICSMIQVALRAEHNLIFTMCCAPLRFLFGICPLRSVLFVEAVLMIYVVLRATSFSERIFYCIFDEGRQHYLHLLRSWGGSKHESSFMGGP